CDRWSVSPACPAPHGRAAAFNGLISPVAGSTKNNASGSASSTACRKPAVRTRDRSAIDRELFIKVAASVNVNETRLTHWPIPTQLSQLYEGPQVTGRAHDCCQWRKVLLLARG